MLGSKDGFEIDAQFTRGDVDDPSSRLCVLGITSERISLPQKPMSLSHSAPVVKLLLHLRGSVDSADSS